ncbi:hypothetical protein FB567DRAFT_500481 [Paraphoma chrysanthemicola]|uniref:Heterokaryon incompatibility domain-containing protein n=1 Tax=Paraphoma chrysanthemicola TaxID=798071 RepID=A0A8K0R163_9PLEO|nr:hypothetical protein FB567DRAFT_500481 [Paraphoma chrysanthemicola]
MSSENPRNPETSPFSQASSATEELARLFAFEVRVAGLKCPWIRGRPGSPLYIPPDPLERVRNLLERGADPNIGLYGYRIQDTRTHGSVGEDRNDFCVHHTAAGQSSTQFLEVSYIEEMNSSDTFPLIIQKEHANFLRFAHNHLNLEEMLFHVKFPLGVATERGDRGMLALLAKFGARFDTSVDCIPPKYWSKVLNPFTQQDLDRSSELLELFIQLSSPDHEVISKWLGENLTTALCLTINNWIRPRGFDAMLRSLCRNGANSKHFRFPPFLTRPGIDVCHENGVTRDGRGTTLLHLVLGDETLAHHLIQLGTNVNETDSFGMSPLLEAVYNGLTGVASLLLSLGADLEHRVGRGEVDMRNINDKQDMPAFELSLNERNQPARSFMARRWCALHIAAHRGHTSIVGLLLDRGANINIVDTYGCSPLDVAVQSSNYETAMNLYTRGCQLNVESKQYLHAMSCAVDNAMYPSTRRLVRTMPTSSMDKSLLETALRQGSTNLSCAETSINSKPPTYGLQHSDALCQSCSRLLKKLQALPLILQSNSASSCRLCCFLQDYNIHQSADTKINVVFKRNVEATGSQPSHLSMNSVAIQKSYKLPIRQMTNDWHCFLQSLHLDRDHDTSSAAALAMANRWLQTCVKSHEKCGHDLDTPFTPTRLLELGENETQILKLSQGVQVSAPYVALSHRWGTEVLPRTTSKNIDDRLHQLQLSELTSTMQDAISVTRRLGFRYIWIDALCIVQDSEEDWLREATQMSQVFSRAIVTLAVADAVDHSQGIFRARRGHYVRPILMPYLLNVQHGEKIPIDNEGEFYVFSDAGLVSSEHRPKGPLDSRGWILQEQLISPRILYFGDGELFWDCTTVSASESSPISSSLLNDQNPDETWALKLIRKTLAGSSSPDTLRQRFADVWVQVIMNYSSRQLSKQSDRLIALQGIMGPLAVLLREDPVAGMWRILFWRQLIWWIQDIPAPPQNSAGASFPAPTWSWLRSQAPVFYHNSLAAEDNLRRRAGQVDCRLPTTDKFNDLESFVNVESIDTSMHPGAIGVQGTLTISGPAFPYRLTTNDLKKTGVKRFHASKWQLNTGKWLLDRITELPLEIHCIIVAEDTAAKMLVCLCLVLDDSPDRWRRVGLCHWDGLIWQVAKFVGKEPEEMTFTIV